MSDTQAQRSRLETQNTPVAIIHSGMFVFANQAFLDLAGVSEFDDLLAIPLLNLVETSDQEIVRQYLHRLETEKTDADTELKKNIKLRTDKKDHNEYCVQFEKTVFDEEECIQITLSELSGSKTVNWIKTLSWRYYLSIAVLLFLSSLPNLLLINLNINNAPTVYFPDDEAAVVLNNELREYFPTDEIVLLLFEGVALYSDGFLNTYHELSERLEEHPKISKVMSVTTQEHISGSADGFFVSPVMDTEILDESHPSERAEIIRADRFALKGLIPDEADALAMVIIPEGADGSLPRLKLLEEINSVIEVLRLDGYLVASAGQVPLDVAELSSMLKDNMTFIPATTVIGLLLIWWLFHRLLAVIVSGMVIGVVVSTTIALYVMANQPFTLIASITPPLLSALTIAALVHFFNAMHYASMRGFIGAPRVHKAVEEIKRPALFTALTTAAGLSSLGLSPIPAIATFGLIAAVGVMLIFVVVIYIVPQIFIRWDYSSWTSRESGLRWMDSVVLSMGRIGIRYPLHVIGVTILVLAIGVPQIFNIKVETNLQEFFSTDHPIRQSTDHIDKTLVGTMPLEVVFRSEAVDGFKRPESLNQIKQFQQWAMALPEVDKATSMIDFIEEMNWGFHEEKEEFRSIPDDENLISQYMLVYDGEDLYDVVDRDFRIARVTLNLNVHSASEIGDVISEIRQYLNTNIDVLETDVAGTGRLFSDMERLLVEGQVSSLGGALVLIFILMLILWRSFWQSLVCMLPNLSPIFLIFIFMGFFNIWLDMATAMIASVAVGIAVDDTIHVFHGFIKRIKKGARPSTALIRTTTHAGRAVMTTTIILASQFMILLSSEFIPTSNFGMLTSIGLLTALLFDLLVLPAVLILVYRKKQQAPKEPLQVIDS